MTCSVPVLWQQTLADFIRDGHFWRHLKDAPALRQATALDGRGAREQGFAVVPQEGGIQLVVAVDADDRLLTAKPIRPDWRCRYIEPLAA